MVIVSQRDMRGLLRKIEQDGDPALAASRHEGEKENERKDSRSHLE
jgi:hypothetical protein